jgi:hypothetical protein
MLAWSWRKYPDILVDFGRELYIPWQISCGQVLYRDLAHLFGPLSSYFNALLFKIFGISYTVIILSNIITLSFFLTGLYILLSKISSRLAAYTSCAVVIFVFAFSQYVFIGNYNFISPYSHEAIHGIILSLFLIVQFYKFIIKRSKYHLISAGLIFGFIFLTKIEVLFSAVASTCFFFLLFAKNEKKFFATVKSIGVFLIAALVPITGFLIYFGTAMPVHDAVKAILQWNILFNRSITNNQFYLKGMGFDNIFENLMTMCFHSLVALSTISIVYVLNYYYIKYKDKIQVRCLCAICFAAIIGMAFYVNPYTVGRSLPLLSFLTFLFLLIYYLKLSTKDKVELQQLTPLLLWSVLSICLLLKIILNCRIFHYGFYLTLPSFVLLIVMLIWFLPKWIDKRFSGGYVFRNVMFMIIIVIAGHCVWISNKFYKMKSFSIGRGSDRIVTFHPKIDSRGYLMNEAVGWLRSNVDHKETFIVLPEGVMLNYLTKHTNPTRFTNFMIPEMVLFKEDVILAEFIKYSPDYFILVDKDTSEYGVKYFGQNFNYGKKIMIWINEHYDPVCLFGNEPLRDGQFGIKILKKRKDGN